ncbi:MAG: monovalent cation/H(+) antiporter subunit G [Gammaproteobacteria bacterium]|nr:monovalent cation/H(+) antiporter subunit G [Gammaproteobacteria bacterium]
MSLLVELLSGALLLVGGVLCVTGGIGLVRLPDFFSRVHASGLTETLAAPLLLCGLMLRMDWSLDLLKVLLILAFILATNPTASHSMAKAALHGGRRPLIADDADAAGENASSKS